MFMQCCNNKWASRWASRWAMVLGASLACLLLNSNAKAVPLNASKQLSQMSNRLINAGTYTEAELQALIEPLEIDHKIIKLMDSQAEGKAWHEYRAIFLQADRINSGVAFMQTHAAVLAKADSQYGVPAPVIAALIGVETFYGTRMGSRSVLRSLVTLTAAYPRRAAFFAKELGQFLSLVKAEGLVPSDVEGSYAGAIGIPQFMPSSYAAYAVDFNDNGQRDLVNEVEDAIGSVANYLKIHGWRRNQPLRQWLEQPVTDKMLPILKRKAKPQNTIAQLSALGLKLDYAAETPANLMRLQQATQLKYFISFGNFHALTRYNPSNKYAMAIVDLSEEIQQAANP